MAKYLLTTECDARLIEEWRVELPDNYPSMVADEKGNAVWHALEHGAAELLSERGDDEHEREIVLGPSRDPNPMPTGTTPHGYDHRWVAAINEALAGRESSARLTDLNDVLWDRFIGPLVDACETIGQPE